MPSRCSICTSPSRAEIEKALLTRPLRVIERQFQVNKTSLWRHKNHIVTSLAKAIEDRETACGDGLATEIRNLIGEAHRLRGKAEQKRDIRTALRGLDVALKAVELYGRATGEIAGRGPSVTVNVKMSP